MNKKKKKESQAHGQQSEISPYINNQVSDITSKSAISLYQVTLDACIIWYAVSNNTYSSRQANRARRLDYSAVMVERIRHETTLHNTSVLNLW